MTDRVNTAIDYYAVLNVSREASPDEIKIAYRGLCILYHPDKHQDAELRKVAQEMFSKIQKAYSVLSDAKLREIYDVYGVSGLEAGQDVALYYGTRAEIKAEMESRKRNRDEEKRRAMANAKSTMELVVDAQNFFDTDDSDYLKLAVERMAISQSIATQLTDSDTLKFNGRLITEDRRGFGCGQFSLRHRHTDTLYTEGTVGIGSQNFVSLKAQKTLEPGCDASGEVFLNQSVGPGFSLGIYRTLGQHTSGLFQWYQTLQDSSYMSTGLFYNREKYSLNGTLQLGEPDSHVEFVATRQLTEHTKLRLSAQAGLLDCMLSYGGERSLGENDKLQIAVELSLLDGVTVRFKYRRFQQVYTIPVHLSGRITPEVVMYATIVPLVAYSVVRRFIIVPLVARDAQRKKAEARRKNDIVISERRREALASVRLMQETVGRKIEEEESVGGLIIVQAVYGLLVGTVEEGDAVPMIDVTVPLQCLVKESALKLHGASKANLVGFYDPCPDEEKVLRVRYRFQGELHEVTIDDDKELKIPLSKHRLRQ